MGNIVLCSDGTGNTAIKGRGTNVWKLYEALDLQKPAVGSSDPQQLAYYDDGVGTERFRPLRLVTGALGLGLSRNVRQLYRFLCRSYRPGDRIYMFGFSRGAFTIRTLAGLVTECGVVDLRRICPRGAGLASSVDLAGELEDRIDGAWKAFRAKFTDTESDLANEHRERYAVTDEDLAPEGRMGIRFIGVWDTVDAYGFPVDEIADLWNAWVPFKFPNLRLSDLVDKGCHAVAIDDARRTFHPVMWESDSSNPDRVEQVWFAGVHSNVGGGYPKQGMSLVSLDWMMARAEDAGLRFLSSARREYRERRNVNDRLYDSRSGLAASYAYGPRDIAETCRELGIPIRIHGSVLERVRLGTEDYAPVNLPREAGFVGCGEDVSLPDRSDELKRRQKTREHLQLGTNVFLTLLGLVAVVALSAWALAGRGSLWTWLETSVIPSVIAATAATSFYLWAEIKKAVRELTVRGCIDRRKFMLRLLAPWRLLIAVTLFVAVGSVLERVEFPVFTVMFAMGIVGLLAYWGSSVLYRRRVQRETTNMWFEWACQERWESQEPPCPRAKPG